MDTMPPFTAVVALLMDGMATMVDMMVLLDVDEDLLLCIPLFTMEALRYFHMGLLT